MGLLRGISFERVKEKDGKVVITTTKKKSCNEKNNIIGNDIPSGRGKMMTIGLFLKKEKKKLQLGNAKAGGEKAVKMKFQSITKQTVSALIWILFLRSRLNVAVADFHSPPPNSPFSKT